MAELFQLYDDRRGGGGGAGRPGTPTVSADWFVTQVVAQYGP